MKSGILIINKDKDFTSRDVVNVVCKKLGTKKVGHTGTLDPLATGVLVLGVNEGTKIIDILTSNDKEYIATVKIGLLTDTLDITGNVIKQDSFCISRDDLVHCLNSFKGKYMQEVPKYSAIRINGKRLYEYARNDEEIELPKREVEIKEIELLNYSGDTFEFRVLVSKGTYIRSLIRDIGEKLNVFMTMSELKRTKQGIFDIEKSIKLDDVNFDSLISIGEALTNFNKLYVDEKLEIKIKNGAKIFGNIIDLTLIYNQDNNLLAIYKPDLHNDIMRPYKVFKGE